MKPRTLIDHVSIELEMTRQCNMRCFYCHIVREPHKEPDMTTAEWRGMLNSLLQILKDTRKTIHFAGGEPFLFDGTVPLMKYLCSEGVTTSVVSNGLILPEDLLAEPLFKDKRLFCFNLSLDGDRIGHETSRRNFDRVTDSLDKLLRADIATVVRTTVHKRNIHRLRDFFEYANGLGNRTDRIVYLDFQPVAAGIGRDVPEFDDIRLDIVDYLDAAWDITKSAAERYPMTRSAWRFLSEMTRAFGPDRKALISSEGALFGCAAGLTIEIRSNGDVARCEMDGPMANIRTDHGVDRVERLLDLLESASLPNGRCMQCDYKWACGMCRLAPTMHGYTRGFGFTDCAKLMKSVETWHAVNCTARLAAVSTEAS